MRFYDEKLNGVGAHPVTLAQKGMAWARSWWTGDQNALPKKAPETDPKDRVRFVRGVEEEEDSDGSDVDDGDDDDDGDDGNDGNDSRSDGGDSNHDILDY